MKDKEKQIEEMAKDLEKMEFFGTDNFERKLSSLCLLIIATKLYEQGYCKLPKDARVFIPTDEQYIMLSREELKNLSELKKETLDLKGKETAEKIFSRLFEEHSDFKETDIVVIWQVKDVLRKIAKQFGVEIKE